MESLVSGMLKEYEEGTLNRRQLIQGLAAALVAAYGAEGTAQSGGGFKAISVDHISFQVPDYKRIRDQYTDLLGMSVQNDNGTNTAYLRFRETVLIARTPATAVSKPNIDHIAYRIQDWDTDKVKAELDRRGLKGDRAAAPRLDVPALPTNPHYVSYHVQDPDGLDVEIAGIAKPGDSQYK